MRNQRWFFGENDEMKKRTKSYGSGKGSLRCFYILLICMAWVGLQTASASPQTAQSDRPNLVYILLDDLDEVVMPYWDALPKTKTLLQNQGMTFTQAFTPAPICCPARTSLLSGKYAHNTGVYNNFGETGGYGTFKKGGHDERTFAVHLQKGGYTTMLAGKFIHGAYEEDPTYIPKGWTEWYGQADNQLYFGYNYKLNENGTLVSYGRDAKDYNTDVIRDKSVDFIRRQKDNSDPFMMWVCPTAPHLPLPPAPRHENHPWKNAELPKSPNYNEPDVTDKPKWLRESADQRSRMMFLHQREYPDRMGSLLAVDDMVEAIYNELEKTGKLENTYIIFASDNGYNLGAHRLGQKMAPYEESIRVPMVVKGPGVPKGSQESRFALHVDYAPTLLHLAGLPIPEDMDGVSLVPLLKGENVAKWRNEMLIEYKCNDTALMMEFPEGLGGLGERLREGGIIGGDRRLGGGIGRDSGAGNFGDLGSMMDVPSYRAVRTQDHLLTYWYDEGPFQGITEYEMYDVTKDPHQLQNMLGTSASPMTENSPLFKTLKVRLDKLATCSGASCRDNMPIIPTTSQVTAVDRLPATMSLERMPGDSRSLRLALQVPGECKVELFTSNGRRLAHWNLEGAGRQVLDLPKIRAGLYSVRATGSDWSRTWSLNPL